MTGFGVVDLRGNHLAHVASGAIRVEGEAIPARLGHIFRVLGEVLDERLRGMLETWLFRVYLMSPSTFLDDDAQGILAVTILYMARGAGTGLGPIVSRWLTGSRAGPAEAAIGFAYLWAAGLYFALSQASSLPLAAALVLLAPMSTTAPLRGSMVAPTGRTWTSGCRLSGTFPSKRAV